MKPRDVLPTRRERLMREGDYIVSATNLEGRITSVNPVLVEFSGYDETELIGAQHNILRHPDMPRAVFWMAWEAIRHGDDFYGYIKNLAKDGSYYWVFAHILPEYDAEGTPTGYRSVRRCPRGEAVAKAAALYEKMLAAERAVGSRDAIEAGLAVLRAALAEAGQSYEVFVATL
jgi:PAS domain S-box-containing protein